MATAQSPFTVNHSGTSSSQQPLLPDQVDLVIVGYGPVGAALATYLGKLGISTLVIDKADCILPMPRAIALDNEALRVLQLIGLDQNSFEKIIIKKIKMRSPDLGTFAEFNSAGQVDELPRLVTFYQPDLEAALRQKVSTYAHIQVALTTEFVEFKEFADSLQICLRSSSGELKWVNCQYLIGADGACSKIRELIGQTFTGQTYIEDWLIVDANHREGKAIDHVEFICDPKRPIPHMPAPGGRERWEFMLQPGETREDMERPEKIKALLKPWIDTDISIERKAVYRFHARCCDQFQKGRVFLVGDAAHITPPFVGQGLVAGLRDIANLGWKLSWVLQQQASDKILHSYDQERRPHAKKMIEMAKLMGHLVMPSNRLKAFAVHSAIKTITHLPITGSYLTELKIKPQNRYKQGLFIKKLTKTFFGIGGQIDQIKIKNHQGHIALSDDHLGEKFAVIGLGVDPRLYISQDVQAQWIQAGGSFHAVTTHQISPQPVDWLIDLNNQWMAKADRPWLVVVRPDKIIVSEGEVKAAQKIVASCLKLMA